MSTSRIAYNVIAQFSARLVAAGLTVIVVRISSRYLGPESYGHLVTVTSFVNIFWALADWGIAVIAAREIARDQGRSSEILGSNLGLRLAISVTAVPLILLLNWAMNSVASQEVTKGIALLSFTVVTNSVATSVGAIFVARVRNDIPAAVEVGIRVLSVAGAVFIVDRNLGFFGFIWLQIVGSLVMALVTVLLARRFVRFKPIFRLKLWRPLIVMAIPLGVVHALHIMYFRLDSVILSILRSATEVGYYGVAFRVVELTIAIPIFFMVALMPSLVSANPERLNQLIQRAFDALAAIAIPILIIGLVFGSPIIQAISSPAFAPAVTPLSILLFGSFFTFIAAVFGHALVATGRQARLVPVALVTLGVNLGLNFALVPGLGPIGAATATAVAEAIALVYVARIFYRATGIRPSLALLPRLFFCGAAMAGFGFVMLGMPALSGGGALELIISVASLVASYVGMLLLLRVVSFKAVRAVFWGRR